MFRKNSVRMYGVLNRACDYIFGRKVDHGSDTDGRLATSPSLEHDPPALGVSEHPLPWNARAVVIRDPNGLIARGVVFSRYLPTPAEMRSARFLLESDERINPDENSQTFLWILENGVVRIESAGPVQWGRVETWSSPLVTQRDPRLAYEFVHGTWLVVPRLGNVRLLDAGAIATDL